MKMRKVMSALLVAAMTTALMTGCGSGSGSSSSDSGAASDSGSSADSGSDSAEDSGSEEGGKFKIGGIGPVTGGAAVYGEAVKNGAELAVKEINEAGGIDGVEIDFNYQDDEHDPEKAVNA